MIIKECGTGTNAGVAATAVSGSIGTAPTPALTSSLSNGGPVMVNGKPVAGKSVKKKKKSKKNENIVWVDSDGIERTEIDPKPSDELDRIDKEETIRNLAKKGLLDSPEKIFSQGSGIDEPEFEDALNILKFGSERDDIKEYNDLIDSFIRCGRFSDYLRFIKTRGLSFKDIQPENIGKHLKEELIYKIEEDFNEAYERITNLLAKQLDRMNFEFANTEEIIYKKEGKYKYLLKFDNKDGILKFNISKDGNIIWEKEWELEEKEDVTPIFKEIEDVYNKYGI